MKLHAKLKWVSTAPIKIVPSCSISNLTPVSSIISLIFLPPGPMTSRIFSAYAPKVEIMHIKPEKIRDVIGPGGKKINEIIDETGVKLYHLVQYLT
jgi:hypothetical protein